MDKKHNRELRLVKFYQCDNKLFQSNVFWIVLMREASMPMSVSGRATEDSVISGSIFTWET